MPAKKPRFPVQELIDRLEAVYGNPRMIARFDPMEELVSCILSQHTTDANSFPAFTKLRETYADWQAVIDAGPEKVADTIRGAGLANQKARNIIGTLIKIRQQNGDYSLEMLRGKPMLSTRDWLMELPGVGPKTASIVLCFAMGEPAIPVDTHVYRVSWRLGLIPEGIGESKAHDALLAQVPGDMAFRFHTALIQHGRVTCRAPIPLCHECVATDLCQWYRTGGPQKRKAELALARKRGQQPKGRPSPRRSVK